MEKVIAGLFAVADGLARARTVEEVASIVLGSGRDATGAAAGALFIVAGDALVHLASRGYPEGATRGFDRLALDAPVPIAEAVRRGAAVFAAGAQLAAYPALASALACSGTRALAAVPLLVDGRALGALGFSFFEPHLVEHQRRFLDAIGQLAAQAIDRAQLFDADRAARARLAELYDLGVALAAAPSLEAVAGTLTGAGRRTLRAFAGAVFVAEEGGALRALEQEGLGELAGLITARPDLVAPIPDTFRDGAVRAYPSAAAFAEAYPALPRHGRAMARIAAPLTVGERTLGVLAIAAEERAAFEPAELQHAVAIAHQGALALDRVRAFERERAARAEAELASRLREDLIAVVSHDLRNPLASLTSANELLGLQLPPGADPRLARYVGTIARAAERMNRLLDDLLDVAQLDAGRLQLAITAEDVVAIAREAIEQHEPVAGAKSIALALAVAPPRACAMCSRDRVMQVLGNLLGNAIKFTAAGGRISVEVAGPEAGQIAVSVADTGAGISAEQLPFLFDRYWQARRGARNGIGLGLAIARGLVEAQGGALTVDSAPGRGSVFRFTLPAAP